MTGASFGNGGNRYYISGKSGEALVGAGLLLDSVEFGLAGMLDDIKRGEHLHARQQEGEILDEVDQEYLAKYLEDLKTREANAQEKMRKRMERRTAPLRLKASMDAKAAQWKIDGDARAEYQLKRAATGLTDAESKSFWIQFNLIGVGMAIGMIALDLLAK